MGGAGHATSPPPGLHLGAVLVAQEMQQPVHEWPPPLVADDLRAEDDVAELAGHAGGQRVAAVDREREHVGGFVDPEVLAFQGAALVRADERDPELALVDALLFEDAAGELGGRVRLHLHPAAVLDLDLNHRRRCVPVASACSR